MTRVLCIGSVNVDDVWELDRLPDGEGKVRARGHRIGGGGVAATAAVAVSALGGEATLCGVLGADDAGRRLRRLLAAARVDVWPGSLLTGAPTAVAAVMVDADGRRWLAWHGPEAAAPELHGTLPSLTGVGAVVVDLVWPALAAAVLERARHRGIPRIADVESADAPGLGEVLERADHVIFSAEGLASYAGLPDERAGLARAAARLPHATVGVTLGADGSLWWSGDDAVHVPAPTVEAKDTTGCGDVFHGAYALAVAEGRPRDEAARFASAAAAIKARNGAAWDGMPERAQTETLIEEAWT